MTLFYSFLKNYCTSVSDVLRVFLLCFPRFFLLLLSNHWLLGVILGQFCTIFLFWCSILVNLISLSFLIVYVFWHVFYTNKFNVFKKERKQQPDLPGYTNASQPHTWRSYTQRDWLSRRNCWIILKCIDQADLLSLVMHTACILFCLDECGKTGCPNNGTEELKWLNDMRVNIIMHSFKMTTLNSLFFFDFIKFTF